MIAATIGPYRVLARVGAGGMGEVYRAEDPRLGRDVALKVLTADLGPDARERLLHEARAAAKLNHPAVASIYDVLECDDRLCLVMEFVEGETLVSRLARGPRPVEEVLALSRQLLEGLAHAHEHGIIHRDLKPANLIVTPDERLKILDFGIAHIRPPSERKPGPIDRERREVSGSPGYSAPEQLMGHQADGRSDLYSVGVVMFQALTGRLPYETGGTIGSVLGAVLEEAPPVGDLNPCVPSVVGAIVAQALRRNPAERFASAAGMLHAVTRAASGLAERPTVSMPRDERLRRPRWRGRRYALPAAAITALVVLAVAWRVGVADWFRPPPPPATRHVIAVLPLENLAGGSETRWLGAGISEAIGMNLSKVQALTVISRADVVEAMRRTQDPERIARQLGATLLVDGSVQEWQRRVRATVRLVRPDGHVVWSDVYEAPVDAIFALESEIAEAVPAQLRLTVTPRERARIAHPATTSMDALTAYWKGQEALERATLTANLRAALENFRHAVSLDAGFAAAYAALARAYWMQYTETRDVALTARATESAVKALTLDPEQPSTRISLAIIYAGTGQYQNAEIELRRALALQPASDEAYRELAKVLLQQNRTDEAIDALQHAILIRPEYWRNHADLGIANYQLRRLEPAKAAFQRAIDLQPDNPASHNNLGIVYAQLGDRIQALAEFERANALTPTRRGFANLGMYYAEAGRLDEALQAYRRALSFDTRSDVTYGNVGDVLARLGRTGDARREYGRARTLALQLLEVNNKDAAVLSRLAVFEAKLGMRREALTHAGAAIQLAPRDPEVTYKLAVVQVRLRQADAALATLSRAIAYGYSPSMARGDHDLAALRDRPEFQKSLLQPVTGK